MMRANTTLEDLFLSFVRAGYFVINASGEVWRVAEMNSNREWRQCRPRRAEKSAVGAERYFQIRFRIGGRKQKAISAHRVVWRSFNGAIPEGIEVNHLNGNKHDNRPGNLELVTPNDNKQHAYRTGLRICAAAKIDLATAGDIRSRRAAGASLSDLADRYGVSTGTVRDIVNWRTWRNEPYRHSEVQ